MTLKKTCIHKFVNTRLQAVHRIDPRSEYEVIDGRIRNEMFVQTFVLPLLQKFASSKVGRNPGNRSGSDRG